MYGVLRGVRCGLPTDEKRAWMGHLCGTCLSLGKVQGQAARLTTNWDAALLSALYDAQCETPDEAYQSHCPLRSEFSAPVAHPESKGAQFAAAVALVMGSTKIEDHVADGDGIWPKISWLGQRASQRWSETGRSLAHALNFDTTQITRHTNRQTLVEANSDQDFFYYAQPTELAAAAAFGHTAILAGQPQNQPILHEIGRLFGRLMYLFDSYTDLEEDVAANKFNPLVAAFPIGDRLKESRRIYRQTVKQLKQLVGEVGWNRPELIHKLLVVKLPQKGNRLFSLGTCQNGSCSCRAASEEDDRGRRRWYHCCDGVDLVLCCDCGGCCNCCSDCDADCCECDGCCGCDCCCDCDGCDGCCDGCSGCDGCDCS